MTASLRDIIKSFLSHTLYNLFLPAARPLVLEAPKGLVLVLAPHPDDESFGCGALISSFTAQDVDVHILVITDGSGSSHPPSVSKADLAAIRRQEILQAAALLGCAPAHVTFLDLPDQGTPDHQKEITERLQSHIEKLCPKILISPCREDRHPDHVVTAKVIDALVKNGCVRCPVLSYPIWFWPLQALQTMFFPSTWRRLHAFDARPFLDQKKVAIGAHKTQTGAISRDHHLWCPLKPLDIDMQTKSHELYFLEHGKL